MQYGRQLEIGLIIGIGISTCVQLSVNHSIYWFDSCSITEINNHAEVSGRWPFVRLSIDARMKLVGPSTTEIKV